MSAMPNQYGLLPYLVHSGYPEERAVLIMAGDKEQAVQIALDRSDLPYNERSEVVAEQSEPIDELSLPTVVSIHEPTVISDNRVLREFGFGDEDDDWCHCGRSSMGGEFPVCEDCEYCVDCGCVDECELKTFPIPVRA